MTKTELLKILKNGDVNTWNQWREDYPDATIDLSYSNLYMANLPGINLRNAILKHSHMSRANFNEANFEYADLKGVHLFQTKLRKANLRNSKLVISRMVQTDFEGANLDGSAIYGASVWNVKLSGASQKNLKITQLGEPAITVDNLEVAQFIYLILNNEKIRNVIDEITSKAALLLGRFSILERKMILDSMKDKLRELGFLPIVFDFEQPTDKDFTETIITLAGMSRFIIADVTNPKSSPLELQAIVPNCQIPLVPIIQGEEPFPMLRDLQSKYDWVLDVFRYENKEELMDLFDVAIVNRALKKHTELRMKKASETKVLTAEYFRKLKR